jgi:hypothetical protein
MNTKYIKFLETLLSLILWTVAICTILTIGIQIGIRHERAKTTQMLDVIMNTGLTP